MYQNDIVAGHNGLAEKDGAVGSWEHLEQFPAVTET